MKFHKPRPLVALLWLLFSGFFFPSKTKKKSNQILSYLNNIYVNMVEPCLIFCHFSPPLFHYIKQYNSEIMCHSTLLVSVTRLINSFSVCYRLQTCCALICFSFAANWLPTIPIRHGQEKSHLWPRSWVHLLFVLDGALSRLLFIYEADCLNFTVSYFLWLCFHNRFVT